ncbi:MAG: hypothetical protein FIB06_03445 [Betaproteobacteria bacterium]|nr:hypothetical protein [Betaproteobacteria bacterium]
MNKWANRTLLAACWVAISGPAAAVGLGELRGNAVLGDRPRLEIDVLGTERMSFDATCFTLRQPTGAAGVPWLQKGQLALRRGKPPVLQISSHLTLADPVIAVAVHIGCGQDVVREYVVLVGEPGKRPSSLPPARYPALEASVDKASGATAAPRAPASPPMPKPAAPAPVQAPIPVAADPVAASDDKVRAMEAQVAALQQRASDLTQRIEQAAPQTTPAPVTPAEEAKPAPPVAAPVAPPPRPESSGWGIYALLAAIVLAIAGWLGWRSYRDRRGADSETEFDAPPIRVDARRAGERDERGGVAMDVDPAAMAMPAKIDMGAQPRAPARPVDGKSGHDSMMSIAAASLDEHFEANPVMELAEIMLSFGRVKGAAQALQEFIDTNPKEALKPWIRLLDVYRMAGMRHEFERVANELNRHFNVQVQRWEDSGEAGHTRIDVLVDAERLPAPPTAGGLEDMPRVVDQVVAGWRTDDAVAVLDDLLRDNRDGARVGFPLPVVDDLLFLIDLRETRNKMAKENEK